jgi:hypothetical protein
MPAEPVNSLKLFPWQWVACGKVPGFKRAVPVGMGQNVDGVSLVNERVRGLARPWRKERGFAGAKKVKIYLTEAVSLR